jgi:hypothetical protein
LGLVLTDLLSMKGTSSQLISVLHDYALSQRTRSVQS